MLSPFKMLDYILLHLGQFVICPQQCRLVLNEYRARQHIDIDRFYFVIR